MIKSLRRVLIVFRKYRARLVISQVLVLTSATATIGVAALNQRMINQGIEAGSSDVVFASGLTMAILAIIAGLCLTGAAYLAVFFSQGTAYVIRAYLYRKIQTFSFANFDTFHTGNLLVRLNADVINIQNAIMYATILTLYAPFMMLVALVLTLMGTPQLIWVLLLVVAVVLGIMALLVPRIFKAYDERQRRLDLLNNTLQENLAGVRVVKAFVREDYEVERFDERANNLRAPAFSAAFMVGLMAPFLTGITQIAIAASLGIGGTTVLEGTGLNVGQLVAFTQYLAMVISPLAMLAILVPFILRGDASAARILDVYDSKPDVQDRESTREIKTGEVKGKIQFENVTFAFRRPDGELDPPVLKNINLTIQPGESIGFLGATGAGKSALINLIPRFYDVTEGRIIIDDIDVRDYPQETLRQIVGIALQEALLFQGDVRFNLKFSKPNAEDEEMIMASKAADSYGFITKLPEKWEAPVARRGYNFSGGQRQRLSMSRTMTNQPRILIMDDSTSALDVATEARVQKAIPDTYPGLTTLYVAQRISAVIDLDNIVLLENGEIIASGTHEKLMESSPLYQEIYESQLGSGITTGLDEEVGS
jgi:ATP-binding cassette subfamily B protein